MTLMVLPRLRPGADRRLVVIAASVALGLAAGILVNWAIAASIVGVVFVLALRPWDVFTGLLVVALAGSFVNNEGGHMTRELSVVTALLAYALFSLLIAVVRKRWRFPNAPFVTALLALELWTLACAVRGVAAGHELRYLGLEWLPILGLLFALMVGGVRLGAADLRLAFVLLAIGGAGHVALGLVSYAIHHVRTGGVWFTPVPGILALLLFNLMLRTDRRMARFGMLVLFGADLLHQMISLTRGYWMGLAAGLVLSTWVYVTSGNEFRRRSLRALVVFGWIAVAGVVGTIAVGAYFGWGDVASLFGARLASSFGTVQTSETASNVARLVEWLAVARKIVVAPWFGYGLGYAMHVHFPFADEPSTQWFVHEQYLYFWLKQGIVGLVLLGVVLVTATWLGVRSARRLEGERAAWAATAAAATAYTAVLGLTNYPLAMVNSTFLLALLWGIALSLSGPGHWRFVWRLATRRKPAPS